MTTAQVTAADYLGQWRVEVTASLYRHVVMALWLAGPLSILAASHAVYQGDVSWPVATVLAVSFWVVTAAMARALSRLDGVHDHPEAGRPPSWPAVALRLLLGLVVAAAVLAGLAIALVNR
jgi:hypothetical protein